MDSVIRFLESCNGFYHPCHEKYKINETDLAIRCTLLCSGYGNPFWHIWNWYSLGVQRPATKADSLAGCRSAVQLIFFTVFSLSSFKGKIGNKKVLGVQEKCFRVQKEAPYC